jgi:LacI family transcriptional regulator
LTNNRVTSQEVARRAGVSRTTVSLVLNDVPGVKISPETRQRVLKAAYELNYVPDAAAQALASRRARIVGLILIRHPRQISTDAFLTQTLNGLIETIRQDGMRLLIDIVEPQHQKKAYLQLIRAKRIDGIILSGPRYDDEALNALQEIDFPTVLLGQLPGSKIPSVDVDNRAAAYTAVAHLIKLGHSQIACITNAPVTYTAASDRLDGYRKAIEDHGIAFDLALVRYGDFDIDSGYRQMRSLIESRLPFSAVFVSSDTLAYGATAAIRENGLRIPEDIALVGFDDLPFSHYSDPPLTTVHLPAVELARRSAEILLQLLQQGDDEKQQIILDTQLVVRQSCGALH